MEKLKPCPFCGSKVEIFTSDSYYCVSDILAARVSCSGGGCFVGLGMEIEVSDAASIHEAKEMISQRWNTRWNRREVE